MVSASLRESTTRESGFAFLLLFASLLAQLCLPRLLDRVSTVAVRGIGPRPVAAVVYTILGLLVLAVVLAARRHLAGRPPLAVHERVQVGGAATLILFVGSLSLLRVRTLPVLSVDILRPLLTGGVAMGLLALGYARWRGIDVPLALPDTEYRIAGSTVGLAALAALAWIVGVVVADPPMLSVATGGGPGPDFGPDLSAGRFLRDVMYPAVLVGAGSGLLYNGGVQEPLREMGPARAVAAVPAVVGTSAWALRLLVRTDTPLVTAASVGGAILLAVGVAALAVAAVPLAERFDLSATPAVGAAVGPLLVAVSLAAVALVSAPVVAIALYTLSYTAAAAVAAYGYERTRSVWVPAAAFAVHLALVDWTVVVFVARLL